MNDVFDDAQRAICDAMIQRGAILTDSACESVLTILRERFGEAVKDAARVEWLESQTQAEMFKDVATITDTPGQKYLRVFSRETDWVECVKPTLRAAIDAAMKP